MKSGAGLEEGFEDRGLLPHVEAGAAVFTIGCRPYIALATAFVDAVPLGGPVGAGHVAAVAATTGQIFVLWKLQARRRQAQDEPEVEEGADES